MKRLLGIFIFVVAPSLEAASISKISTSHMGRLLRAANGVVSYYLPVSGQSMTAKNVAYHAVSQAFWGRGGLQAHAAALIVLASTYGLKKLDKRLGGIPTECIGSIVDDTSPGRVACRAFVEQTLGRRLFEVYSVYIVDDINDDIKAMDEDFKGTDATINRATILESMVKKIEAGQPVEKERAYLESGEADGDGRDMESHKAIISARLLEPQGLRMTSEWDNAREMLANMAGVAEVDRLFPDQELYVLPTNANIGKMYLFSRKFLEALSRLTNQQATVNDNELIKTAQKQLLFWDSITKWRTGLGIGCDLITAHCIGKLVPSGLQRCGITGLFGEANSWSGLAKSLVARFACYKLAEYMMRPVYEKLDQKIVQWKWLRKRVDARFANLKPLQLSPFTLEKRDNAEEETDESFSYGMTPPAIRIAAFMWEQGYSLEDINELYGSDSEVYKEYLKILHSRGQPVHAPQSVGSNGTIAGTINDAPHGNGRVSTMGFDLPSMATPSSSSSYFHVTPPIPQKYKIMEGLEWTREEVENCINSVPEQFWLPKVRELKKVFDAEKAKSSISSDGERKSEMYSAAVSSSDVEDDISDVDQRELLGMLRPGSAEYNQCLEMLQSEGLVVDIPQDPSGNRTSPSELSIGDLVDPEDLGVGINDLPDIDAWNKLRKRQQALEQHAPHAAQNEEAEPTASPQCSGSGSMTIEEMKDGEDL